MFVYYVWVLANVLFLMEKYLQRNWYIYPLNAYVYKETDNKNMYSFFVQYPMYCFVFCSRIGNFWLDFASENHWQK